MSENKFTIATNLILKLANEDAEKNCPWEDGDQQAFIFNDGVGILSLKDNTFNLDIIAGNPTFVDHVLGLIQNVERSDGK
jgi:hypothetical protein